MTGMDSVFVALALHAAAASPTATGAIATPSFLMSLPCAGVEGAYSEIYGVCSDGGSGVFVVDYWDQRVYRFDAAGAEVTHWPAPGAHGIAVSAAGEVYVSDNSLSIIDVYSTSGVHLRQFGQLIGAFGILYYPTYLCVTPEGTLLVSDSQNQRVVEFTPDGVPIRAWGGPGTAPGQFGGPRGIAMDASGEILVVDEGNRRVQVFSRTGSYLREWPVRAAWYEGFSPVPRGISIDDLGRIYVTDRTNCKVRVFDPGGDQIASWGGYGLTPGLLYGPNAVAFTPGARLYVGESNCHVQVFARDGVTAARGMTWGALKTIYR